MPKLKTIEDNTIIYARPEGSHFHLDRNCTMLQDGDFERLGYIPINKQEITKRKLRPCGCAYSSIGSK